MADEGGNYREDFGPEGSDSSFSVLVGPHGFECALGEPEDRTWSRDGKAAVDELNRLRGLLLRANAIIAHAIVRGMTITEEVAAVRNEIVLGPHWRQRSDCSRPLMPDAGLVRGPGKER